MILRELVMAFGALLFLSLPLWPAISEALWPSDEEPLTISRHQLQDPRGSFKQVAWRYCVMFGLEEPGQLFSWLGRQLAGEIRPGVMHLVGGGEVPGDFAGTDLISSSGELRLATSGRWGGRLFSTGDLTLGLNSESFEAHAGGLLRLEAGSRLLWWGTGAEIRLGRGAQAPGALRAEREIRLEPGAGFLYLRAPLIGVASQAADAFDASVRFARGRSPRGGTLRQVFDGDHEVAAGEAIHGDLIVRGDLRVGENARIYGSIKAHGSVALGPGTWVEGAVVANVGVQVGRKAQVGGCVLGETWVRLDAGAKVGEPGHTATVSGESVQFSADACVHGMIRAWKGGHVVES